jgi:hypothetical protein
VWRLRAGPNVAIVLHAAVPRYEWRSVRGVPMLDGRGSSGHFRRWALDPTHGRDAAHRAGRRKVIARRQFSLGGRVILAYAA